MTKCLKQIYKKTAEADLLFNIVATTIGTIKNPI